MSPSRLAFIDTETTGLDPDRHELWEVALVLSHSDGFEEENLWHLPVDLGRADPMALKIGRFHERWAETPGTQRLTPIDEFVGAFADLTVGAHLIGAVVSFDEERLRRLLRANGQCPMWHYHLVDVEALAAGRLGWAPPWNSEELSKAVGVDAADFDRHTALGDARWAKAIYEAVMA